jgi:hypothetical protein
MKQFMLTLSLLDKPNLRRRKRKPANVDSSRNNVRTVMVNIRLSNNGLLDLSRRKQISSHVRDMD